MRSSPLSVQAARRCRQPDYPGVSCCMKCPAAPFLTQQQRLDFIIQYWTGARAVSRDDYLMVVGAKWAKRTVHQRQLARVLFESGGMRPALSLGGFGQALELARSPRLWTWKDTS
jgi:hypothetical protein